MHALHLNETFESIGSYWTNYVIGVYSFKIKFGRGGEGGERWLLRETGRRSRFV